MSAILSLMIFSDIQHFLKKWKIIGKPILKFSDGENNGPVKVGDTCRGQSFIQKRIFALNS